MLPPISRIDCSPSRRRFRFGNFQKNHGLKQEMFDKNYLCRLKYS